MPIKRLARSTGGMFPCIGQLRKGAEKVDEKRPGKDLDYFRFTSDDNEALARFTEFYPDEPRRINVFLPFPSLAENFECWQEHWTAGALQHRCDGETCVRWLDKPTQTYHETPIECPHIKLSKRERNRCKPVGRLKVVIPELRRLAYVMVLTTSEWDILTIQDNLMALEARHGSLQGIPMILSRVPHMISTPRQDGSRTRVEKWLLQIEAAPRWVDLQLQAMEQAALPVGATPLALPAPNGVTVIDNDLTLDTSTGEYHAIYEGECACCRTVQTVQFDGEADICVDREACAERVKQIADNWNNAPVPPAPEEPRSLPPIREITTRAPEALPEIDRLQRDLKALRDAERAINLEPAPFKWNAKQGAAPLKAAIETSRNTLIGYVPGMLDTLEGLAEGDETAKASGVRVWVAKMRDLNPEMLNHKDLIDLATIAYNDMQRIAAEAVVETVEGEVIEEADAVLEPAL